MSIYEELEFILEYLHTDELVRIHNQFIKSTTNNPCRIIYKQNEFENITSHMQPNQIKNGIENGSFSGNERYFFIDRTNSFFGFNSIYDMNCVISINKIAKFIISTKEDFGNSSIAEVLKDM